LRRGAPGGGPRVIRRAVAAVALLALLAGCGLTANAHPREIDAADLPPDLVASTTSTSTAEASPVMTPITAYYLLQHPTAVKLTAGTRAGADPTRPRGRITALLGAPTADEQAAGLLSSIPADTVLLDSDLSETDHELTLDLSRSLFDVQGQELRNAFAQLV